MKRERDSEAVKVEDLFEQPQEEDTQMRTPGFVRLPRQERRAEPLTPDFYREEQ